MLNNLWKKLPSCIINVKLDIKGELISDLALSITLEFDIKSLIVSLYNLTDLTLTMTTLSVVLSDLAPFRPYGLSPLWNTNYTD